MNLTLDEENVCTSKQIQSDQSHLNENSLLQIHILFNALLSDLNYINKIFS
jgi:hypothetical protein